MKEALNNAKVVLAMKADGETIDKIEAFVRARGCDGARYKIDPSIGGGIIIYIGDKVYDGSVKTKLAEIKEKLSHGND